jgi:glycosyltransferase involved in cell wall biosynthesis
VRYLLAEVELTEPLPAVALEPDQQGIGLLLRVADRPAAFLLREAQPGAGWPAGALEMLIGDEGSRALQTAALRDALAPPVAPARVGLTVAVCTHGRPDTLAGCLHSLLALRGDGRFELLVVDNAPPDGATRELVAGLPGITYAVEPRPGLDFARNRALAEATGEWIAFLDDDVVADRGWLAGLEEALAENPDAGALTGLVLPAELETEAQIVFERRGGFRRGFRKLRYEGDVQPGNPLYPVGAGMFGAGCNMALRRGPVLALGGFDVALDTGPPLPGGGDLDIFHRVLRAGLPLVYEPRMLVRHRHRRDRAGLRRQYRTWGDGLMAYLAKTYANDPSQRAKVRAMLAWWAGYELGELASSIAGRGWGSPDLPAAELAGGVAGLVTNSYGRSTRRVRAIEARHA